MSGSVNGKEARAAVLAGVRRALGAGRGDADAARSRIAEHPRSLVPARAMAAGGERAALFIAMAEEVSATVERIPSPGAAPAAVAAWLAAHNLPASLRLAPDPRLQALSWAERPTLSTSWGPARDADPVAVTAALAGVAETGTLVFVSGPEHPTTLNFLPDAHIVLLNEADIVGGYEDAWDRVRALPALPRTVNFVTGPSRTADIEQQVQLGAHGPRRLHILLAAG